MVDETAVVCVSPRRSLATGSRATRRIPSTVRRAVGLAPTPTSPRSPSRPTAKATDGDETSYATEGRSGALRRFGFVHYATPILSGLSPATGPAAGETPSR